MKVKRILIPLVLLVILIIGVSIYVGMLKSPAINSNEPIKIGVIGTMSGFAAYFGENQLKGLELAKEAINENGGINGQLVELIVEDSQASPLKSLTAAKKLVEVDQVKYIIGDSWSSTVPSFLPITNQSEIIVISPVASLNDLSVDDYFFRTVPKTQMMMKNLASYAYYGLGARKVGIMQLSNEFGHENAAAFTTEFEALGGEIVGHEIFPSDRTDLKSELIKIKVKNPDTIFNIQSGALLGLMMKQSKELGIEVNWIASYGAENATLIKEYPKISSGLIYPFFYDINSSEPGISEFASAYEKKYNETPNYINAGAYDALNILAKVIAENPDQDAQAIKKALLEVENYQGGSGLISFDSNGDVNKDIFIKQIQESEFVKIED
jgi:branched-chain amino acid transport system substrate-binding protein